MEGEELQDAIARRLVVQTENSENQEEGRSPEEDSDGFHEPEAHEVKPSSKEVGTVRESTTVNPIFAKVEKSLASLGYFTPSSRRIKEQKVKHISFTREVDGKRVEVAADIIPGAVFGLPITADQDKWLALQQIVTDRLRSEGKIANPIRFKSAELLRLLNDSTKSGKNYKEVSEWLDVMMSTTIISNGVVYDANQKRFARDRFKIFDRAVSVGKEMDDGTVADANYVWLSNWQLENINHAFLLPVDLETYRELKNHIAKALVPHLQIWLFASLKAGSFEKRYDELCELFALQQYRAPSLILRQLRPSLDELTRHQYLSKWRIEKTSDRKAYKVVFIHGEKFHRDRRRRQEQKSKVEAPVVIPESTSTEPDLPEPGHLNPQGRTTAAGEGRRPESNAVQKENLVNDLAARGIMPEVAMSILDGFTPALLARVGDCIEHWDELRRSKDVGTGLLYKLVKNGGPLPPDFEPRREREARLAAQEENKKIARFDAEIERQYGEYCKQAIDEAIAALPEGEFEERVRVVREEMVKTPGFLGERPEMADRFARHQVRGEVAKQVSLLSPTEFREGKLPTVTAELENQQGAGGQETEPSIISHNMSPDAVHASPQHDVPEDAGSSTSKENSSPVGV